MNLTIPLLITENHTNLTRPNPSNAYTYFFLYAANSGKVIWQQEGFPPDLEQRITEVIDSVIKQ